MAMDTTSRIMLLFVLMLFWSSGKCNNPHPLDPLTPSELNLVRTIVYKSYPTHNLTFQYVGLDEPDKPQILSWISSKPNTSPPPRRAFVIARFKKQSLEITVDLSTRSIISTNVYKGNGYPMLTFGEQNAASHLPFRYEPLKESIRKRGLNISQVVCGVFTMGWFGEAKTPRTVNIRCFYTNGSANLYARPLEGVTAVVDIDEMKIVGFNDWYVVPVPKAEGTE